MRQNKRKKLPGFGSAIIYLHISCSHAVYDEGCFYRQTLGGLVPNSEGTIKAKNAPVAKVAGLEKTGGWAWRPGTYSSAICWVR